MTTPAFWENIVEVHLELRNITNLKIAISFLLENTCLDVSSVAIDTLIEGIEEHSEQVGKFLEYAKAQGFQGQTSIDAQDFYYQHYQLFE